MSACPFCHRRLLTQASACCNWCGREIPDVGYQKQAEAKREAFFAEQALHDALSLGRIEAIDVNPLLTPLDPLTNLPLSLARAPRPRSGATSTPPTAAFGRPYPAAAATPPDVPAAEAGQPEDTTSGRFRHLEL